MKILKILKVLGNVINLLMVLVLFSCKKKVIDHNISEVNISKKEQKEVSIKKIKVAELSKKEIDSAFILKEKNKLNIKFNIFKVYKVNDNNGETLFIFTENFLKKDNEGNDIINKIELIIASKIQEGYIIKEKISDKIVVNEKSIWFWTKFLKLEDFNNDGYVDPIIVHGGLNEESRLIIDVFNRDEKYQVIHKASDQDLSRYTKFDKNFIKLDRPIRLEVIKLLREVNEKYLAMNSETLELMNNFE